MEDHPSERYDSCLRSNSGVHCCCNVVEGEIICKAIFLDLTVGEKMVANSIYDIKMGDGIETDSSGDGNILIQKKIG